MVLFRSTKSVIRLIADMDLSFYSSRAHKLFGLAEQSFEQAENEYRHFFYLVYWNCGKSFPTHIMPTELADMIWRTHQLQTEEYEKFCRQVFGRLATYRPKRIEQPEEIIAASKHTRMLHNEVGKNGFYSEYMAHISVDDMNRQEWLETVDWLDAYTGASGAGG